MDVQAGMEVGMPEVRRETSQALTRVVEGSARLMDERLGKREFKEYLEAKHEVVQAMMVGAWDRESVEELFGAFEKADMKEKDISGLVAEAVVIRLFGRVLRDHYLEANEGVESQRVRDLSTVTQDATGDRNGVDMIISQVVYREGGEVDGKMRRKGVLVSVKGNAGAGDLVEVYQTGGGDDYWLSNRYKVNTAGFNEVVAWTDKFVKGEAMKQRDAGQLWKGAEEMLGAVVVIKTGVEGRTGVTAAEKFNHLKQLMIRVDEGEFDDKMRLGIKRALKIDLQKLSQQSSGRRYN